MRRQVVLALSRKPDRSGEIELAFTISPPKYCTDASTPKPARAATNRRVVLAHEHSSYRFSLVSKSQVCVLFAW